MSDISVHEQIPDFVTEFDPLLHGPDALRATGMVAVMTAYPEELLLPGSHASLSPVRTATGRAHHEYTGTYAGSTDAGHMAGLALSRAAYGAGLGPGLAGAYHQMSTANAEPLAAAPVKELARQLDTSGYVAFASLVPAESMEPIAWLGRSMGRTPQRAIGVISLRLANVHQLAGVEGGFDGMRDPVDHPIVRQHLASFGLRGLEPSVNG